MTKKGSSMLAQRQLKDSSKTAQSDQPFNLPLILFDRHSLHHTTDIPYIPTHLIRVLLARAAREAPVREVALLQHIIRVLLRNARLVVRVSGSDRGTAGTPGHVV